jgi:RNA 2',3'-cyclic 3'-phosphodiesterase
VSAASPQCVRLFVALELPEGVRAELSEWGGEAAALGALRPAPPASLHITLCFLGSIEVGEIPAIADAVDGAVGECRDGALPLSLGEALWLPPRRPRVLGVGVLDSTGRLGAVQAAIAGALASGGWFEREARPFLAHVTVARVRRGERARPVEVRPPAPLEFEGEAVTLFRSHPGSRYEPLSTALAASADDRDL